MRRPGPNRRGPLSDVWAPSTCDTDIFPRVEGRDPVPMGPFQCAVVSKRLAKFENTAPGDDGLTYRHW